MKEKTKYIIITIVFIILIAVNAMLAIPPTSYIVAFIVGGCFGALLGNYSIDI